MIKVYISTTALVLFSWLQYSQIMRVISGEATEVTAAWIVINTLLLIYHGSIVTAWLESEWNVNPATKTR